jgi:ribose 5-phosphate isomerase A
VTLEEQKRAAALKALELVTDGMRLGLGTGSTAALFVAALGERVSGGLRIVCVPTSEATRRQADELGIPLEELGEAELDLTVDGADEIDGELNLIKGGGGALLREKIVAASSRRMIVIAEGAKRVKALGRFPLPVEVVPFGAPSTARRLLEAARRAGCDGEAVLRRKYGNPFVTDNGNLIYDCHFGAINEPRRLAEALSQLAGVVEHGLFIGLASAAIVGRPEGTEVIGDAGGL